MLRKLDRELGLRRFNGAATFRSRKRAVESAAGPASSGHGFNGAATFRSRKLAIELERACNRMNGSLQWGRDLSVTETRRSRC